MLFTAHVKCIMVEINTIHGRLREERNRLGFSQEKFATIAGVTRRPYVAWEAGETAPTAIQLAALANVGVDVLYVITGECSETALTPDERQLLLLFRASSLTGKMAAIGALQGITGVGTNITATHGGQAAGRDIKTTKSNTKSKGTRSKK